MEPIQKSNTEKQVPVLMPDSLQKIVSKLNSPLKSQEKQLKIKRKYTIKQKPQEETNHQSIVL